MSSRNIRKLFGTSSLPPLEGNSDEEFEPLFVKKTGKEASGFTFEGLEISSTSDSDNSDIPSMQEEARVVEKKKKKKKKQRKPKTRSVVPLGAELDEVERSVMEVNAILGAPQPPKPLVSKLADKKFDPAKQLLSVQSRYLNYQNELKRLFGPETLSDDGKVKKCRAHNVTKYKRNMIVPTPENYTYKKSGLTMSLLKRENGCSYFVFNHSRQYQRMHSHFLNVMNPEEFFPHHDSSTNIHIESLLETADYMFRAEEYSVANSILEQIITCYQNAAHPFFNLTDRSVRLPYNYLENRPYFVVILKYLYMLSNKACHRTALELAKLLMNLDPTDPLAIIYIVDVIALRAREHKWLVDVINQWNKERDALYLFNMKYSYAMAHFHLTKKSKSNDFAHADALLKDAIINFPNVTLYILEAAKHHSYATIQKHEMFQNNVDRPHYVMYAKLVCGKWREPPVMEWFLRNIHELIEHFDEDTSFKANVLERSAQMRKLFADCPGKIRRHLHVVRPMSNLLVEWELPLVLPTRAWDPMPPGACYNRYGYGREQNEHAGQEPTLYSTLINLFTSMSPNFILQEQRVRAYQREIGAGPAAAPEENELEEAQQPADDLVATHAMDRQAMAPPPSDPTNDSSDDSIDDADIEALHHEPSSSSQR